MILDKFPSIEDFYKDYWGKKPFIVRGAIPSESFDDYIDGDTLAGLALEEDIKSRIVITAPEGNKWTCEHGPLEESRFSEIGEENWSLLVQNVEQYHSDTASLLEHFNFSPRWLLDDIMVSYSAQGGSVGPHTDSYHVFLVQGIGKRNWKIGNAPVSADDYVEGQEFKTIKSDFEGTEIDVVVGDIIYIPPNFAHEGKTIEEAMTFSVGFLGPKFSELLIEYGAYLDTQESNNNRYNARAINSSSAGINIASSEVSNIQNELSNLVGSDSFSLWLTEYFSKPTHDVVDELETIEEVLSENELLDILKEGQILSRDKAVKLVTSKNDKESVNLSVYGFTLFSGSVDLDVVKRLLQQDIIAFKDIQNVDNQNTYIEIITTLYNHEILFFEE